MSENIEWFEENNGLQNIPEEGSVFHSTEENSPQDEPLREESTRAVEKRDILEGIAEEDISKSVVEFITTEERTNALKKTLQSIGGQFAILEALEEEGVQSFLHNFREETKKRVGLHMKRFHGKEEEQFLESVEIHPTTRAPIHMKEFIVLMWGYRCISQWINGGDPHNFDWLKSIEGKDFDEILRTLRKEEKEGKNIWENETIQKLFVSYGKGKGEQSSASLIGKKRISLLDKLFTQFIDEDPDFQDLKIRMEKKHWCLLDKESAVEKGDIYQLRKEVTIDEIWPVLAAKEEMESAKGGVELSNMGRAEIKKRGGIPTHLTQEKFEHLYKGDDVVVLRKEDHIIYFCMSTKEVGVDAPTEKERICHGEGTMQILSACEKWWSTDAITERSYEKDVSANERKAMEAIHAGKKAIQEGKLTMLTGTGVDSQYRRNYFGLLGKLITNLSHLRAGITTQFFRVFTITALDKKENNGEIRRVHTFNPAIDNHGILQLNKGMATFVGAMKAEKPIIPNNPTVLAHYLGAIEKKEITPKEVGNYQYEMNYLFFLCNIKAELPELVRRVSVAKSKLEERAKKETTKEVHDILLTYYTMAFDELDHQFPQWREGVYE